MIEYKLSLPPSPPPTYIFVVDVAINDSELESLGDALEQVLGLIPSDSFVGLITFASVVRVHELGFKECVKAHIFRGNKEITREEIQAQLKLSPKVAQRPGVPVQQQPQTILGHRKFLCPLVDCDTVINMVLNELQPEWPQTSSTRIERCTGAALSAAVSLMEVGCYQQPGRILLFSGGVCTSGPGQIVGIDVSESIRQHLDLQRDTANAKYVKKSIAYYTDLSKRAVESGHSIDLFCCALDQTGLYEMKVCAERTGGVVVMSDTFSMSVFRDSLQKLFEVGADGYVQDAFNVKVEVLCTKEIRICGAVGSISSTNKKGLHVAEVTVGEANTCEWAAGVMDKNSTMAIYMEPVNTNEKALVGRSAYLQLQVTYTHPTGERRCRVTTVGYPFANPTGPNGPAELGTGFDQETATVMIARLAVTRTETEQPLDTLRWLDRKLIRLVSTFADYHKDRPETFQLGSEFILYPSFMYHLRRSQFLQIFNAR